MRIFSREVTPAPQARELAPELRRAIELLLKQSQRTFNRKTGGATRLVCANAVTDKLLKDIPTASLSWRLNDEPLTMDASRILFYKGNIDITDLTPGDSGVYECLATWGGKNAVRNLTLGVYSLTVTTESPSLYVFEKEPMKLDCHSRALGRLFSFSKRQWFFNGSEVSQPARVMADSSADDIVDTVNKSMTGVWKCQVSHASTHRTWTTAWYNVQVEDAPSWASRLFRTMKDHWQIVAGVTAIIVFIFFLIFIYSSYREKVTEDESAEEFIKERNGWTTLMTKHMEAGDTDLKSAAREASEGGAGTESKTSSASSSTTPSGNATSATSERSETPGSRTPKESANSSEDESGEFQNVSNSQGNRVKFRPVDLSDNKKLVYKKTMEYFNRASSHRLGTFRNSQRHDKSRPIFRYPTADRVTKESAYKWLLKYSKQVRDLECRYTLLQEKDEIDLDDT